MGGGGVRAPSGIGEVKGHQEDMHADGERTEETLNQDGVGL